MTNSKISSICFIVLQLLFFSCDENETIDYDQSSNGDEFFVDELAIRQISNQIFNSTSESKNYKPFQKNGAKKIIEDILPIGTNEFKPSLYIVNYKDGGFIIISADKRGLPILAFSDENNFEVNEKVFPNFLVEWLKTQDELINNIRLQTKNGNTKHKVLSEYWTIENIESYISSQAINNNSLENKSSNLRLNNQIGPLLNTSWGQGVGYNNSAPNLNCSQYSNRRAPTGCVATSLAQIIRYFEYPSNYDYNVMPNSRGSDEISRLMRDTANSVGMDWGCSGSGAKTEKGADALKNSFGYSSAHYKNFNLATLISELENNFPVILRGGERDNKWLIFDVYDNGHAWICDGFREYVGSTSRPGPRGSTIRVPVKAWTYHMNWGWNGSHNGWYSGSWNVDTVGSFSYKAGMIHNIRK